MDDTNVAQIACIGAGYWGQNLVRNFSQLGVLRWVCDADGEQLDRLKVKYPSAAFSSDASAGLKDPAVSAVAIATPAATQRAMPGRCCSRGTVHTNAKITARPAAISG